MINAAESSETVLYIQITFQLTQIKLRSRLVFCTFSIIFLDLGWNRLVCQRCQTESMSAVSDRIVERLRVIRHALIPDENGAGFVSDPAGKVLAFGNVVEQEAEDTV